MPTKREASGAYGVYLVAAELCRQGLIVSPTSRNTKGADLLVTNHDCSEAFSVQVKTNTEQNDWVLHERHPPEQWTGARSHIWVFVSARKNTTEFFALPSQEVKRLARLHSVRVHDPRNVYKVHREDIIGYKGSWKCFSGSISATVA